MPLTLKEREELLAQPLVAVVSVDSGRPDRGPLSAPVWYRYRPNDGIVLITGSESRKARLIGAAGRFSLLVQRTEPSYRYVSVEGPAAFSPLSEAVVAEIVARYLPADQVPGYVERTMAAASTTTVVQLTPERWTSADIPRS